MSPTALCLNLLSARARITGPSPFHGRGSNSIINTVDRASVWELDMTHWYAKAKFAVAALWALAGDPARADAGAAQPDGTPAAPTAVEAATNGAMGGTDGQSRGSSRLGQDIDRQDYRFSVLDSRTLFNAYAVGGVWGVAIGSSNLAARLPVAEEFDGSARQFVGVGAYAIGYGAGEAIPGGIGSGGPAERIGGVGLAAQYQYVFGRQAVSAQLNFSRQRADWGSAPQSRASAPFWASGPNATYDYEMKYGILVRYFSIWGDPHAVHYRVDRPHQGGGRAERPGYGWEFNYLPKRAIRIALQYANYPGLADIKANRDAFAQIANANNTLYLLAWFKF